MQTISDTSVSSGTPSTTGSSFLTITDEGKTRTITPAPASGATLDAMQAAVGGYIELFMQSPSRHREDVAIDFYCHEEGRLIGLDPNVGVYAGRGAFFSIVGPVLVTASNRDGETIGLTDDELADLAVVPWGIGHSFPATVFYHVDE